MRTRTNVVITGDRLLLDPLCDISIAEIINWIDSGTFGFDFDVELTSNENDISGCVLFPIAF